MNNEQLMERDCLIGWELLERELRKARGTYLDPADERSSSNSPTSDSAYDDAFSFFLDVDLSIALAMLIEINELMQSRIVGEEIRKGKTGNVIELRSTIPVSPKITGGANDG